jgi:hypothetical protein
MNLSKLLVAALVSLALVGCGDSSPRPKAKKTTTPAATTPTTTPAATTPAATPPATTPAATPPATPPDTAKPAETTPAAAPKPAEPAKPADDLVSKASGFENEDIGGKTIGYWVEKLSSKNKDELMEAIECCRLVGGKASLGTAKLNELTNNADAEIAAAAREALHQVRTKKP